MAYRNYGTATGRIVDTSGHGDFTTLAAALAAASSGDTVVLKSSVTENVTLPAGISLTGWSGAGDSQPVRITGTITMTAAGTSTISNIILSTNSADAISITGSSAVHLCITNCQLDAANNNWMTVNNSSASVIIDKCNGNIATNTAFFTLTSCASVDINWTKITSTTSATASNIAAGTFRAFGSVFQFPITSSSTGVIQLEKCNVQPPSNGVSVTTAGTGATHSLTQSRFISGTGSCVSVGTGTTLGIFDCVLNSTNTNPLTGAGTVNYESIIFSNSGKVINTTSATGKNSAFGGITFDKGSNYLSNYATGTYSPAIQGSTGNPTVGYVSQQGNWTRIGDRVYVDINIACSSISGGSGDIQLTLPSITSRSSTAAIGAITINKLTLGARSYITAQVNGGSSVVNLIGFVSAGSSYTYQISDISTGNGLQFITSLIIPV